MIDHAFTEDLSRIKYDIELFLLGGECDLHEDNRIVGGVKPEGAVAEVSFGKVIFSCWSEEWSRSWRVVASSAMPDHLRLRCTKRMGLTACLACSGGKGWRHGLADGWPRCRR